MAGGKLSTDPTYINPKIKYLDYEAYEETATPFINDVRRKLAQFWKSPDRELICHNTERTDAPFGAYLYKELVKEFGDIVELVRYRRRYPQREIDIKGDLWWQIWMVATPSINTEKVKTNE